MKRFYVVSLAALLVVVPALGVAHAQGSRKEAIQLAKKLTEEGAATFDTRNSAAMASYYTDDARVILVGKSEAGLKTTVHAGHSEIQQLYANLFKNAQQIRSRNNVEYARFIGTDLLMITGTFEPNVGAMKVPFVQVRVKEKGKWLIRSVQVFVISDKR